MALMHIFNFILIVICSVLLYCNIKLRESIREELIDEIKGDFVYSSVWCRGSNHTDRQCRFLNLCFWPRTKEFVFFHDDRSILSGIPNNRFPALVDLSSVDDHNTQYFIYVDLPSTSSKNFEIKYIHKTTLVLNRFNPDNLMHVFHDDLLTIFSTLYEISGNPNKCQIRLLFAEDRAPGPYYELYKIFDDEPLLTLEMNKKNLYCFKEAVVGLNKHSTWYDYGFKTPQSPLVQKDLLITSRLIKEFREMFLNVFNLTNSAKGLRKDYAVLITRKNNRLILNEDDVANAIREVTHLEVVTVGLERYSVPEIVHIIKNCSLLIGMHGASLVLTMFLPPESIVIELFPYAVNATYYTPYKTLVNLLGTNIVYKSWQNMREGNTVTHPDNPSYLGGIKHLSEEQQQVIISSKEVPIHLCCYNSEWMFRIYQDTIVDIDSFKAVLQGALKERLTKDKDSKTYLSHLYPGQAHHMKCNMVTVINSQNAIRITWEPPWNLEYISSNDQIQYEIWILLSDTESVTAVIVTETNYLFTDIIHNAEYLVWIRCHVNKRIGPFNIYPVYCNT